MEQEPSSSRGCQDKYKCCITKDCLIRQVVLVVSRWEWLLLFELGSDAFSDALQHACIVWAGGARRWRQRARCWWWRCSSLVRGGGRCWWQEMFMDGGKGCSWLAGGVGEDEVQVAEIGDPWAHGRPLPCIRITCKHMLTFSSQSTTSEPLVFRFYAAEDMVTTNQQHDMEIFRGEPQGESREHEHNGWILNSLSNLVALSRKRERLQSSSPSVKYSTH